MTERKFTSPKSGDSGVTYGELFDNNAEVANVINTIIPNLNISSNRTPDIGINGSGVISPQGGWELLKAPVEQNTDYSFVHNDGDYANGAVGMLAFLDKAENILSTINMDTLSVSDNGLGKKLTTPTNTYYVAKNTIVLAHNYQNDIFVEGSCAVEVPVGVEYIDKNILVLGDSITSNKSGWVKFIQDHVRFKSWTNLAKGGATWTMQAGTTYDPTQSTSANNCIWNQFNKYKDGSYPVPDVVFILAGTNDYDDPNGDPSTVFDNNAQTNTPTDKTDVSSAFRWCIDTINAHFGGIKIIVSTPIPRAIVEAGTYDTAQILKGCADRSGTDLINQYGESGINPYSEKLTRNFIGSDGIHPSTNGNKLLGEFIAKKLVGMV